MQAARSASSRLTPYGGWMRKLAIAAVLSALVVACSKGGDAPLPPGSIDAFCREAASSPFGTAHDSYDPESWREAIEDMHVAAPVDLREETQALVDLEAAARDPRPGPIDWDAGYELFAQLPDLCGIDIDAASSGDDEERESSRLYDTIDPFLPDEGTSYGEVLGHVMVAIPGLTAEEAPAVCEAVVGFRSGLPNADSISILVAAQTEGGTGYEVLAASPPGGDCSVS